MPRSKKTRALLAYLAVTGRPHRRDRLSSLLWEVPDDPRGALRWSLSKIRALVDEPGRARLLADRESVKFDSAGASIDVLELRQASRVGPATLSTDRLVTLMNEAPGADATGTLAAVTIVFAAAPVVGLGMVVAGSGRRWFESPHQP